MIVLGACFTTHAASATVFYNVTDLGSFGTGLSATVTTLNDQGRVAGYAELSGGSLRAFRTLPNSPITPQSEHLGTLGGNWSQAAGINSSGQAVGSSQLQSSNSYHAFCTAANSTINIATDDLGTLGGANSEAYGVNDLGQVVGSAQKVSGQFHAFRTAANSAINPATDDLGVLTGHVGSVAYALNSAGQAAGSSYSAAGVYRAFRTAANAAINPATDDLGTLGGNYSEAFALNASGRVVGSSTDSAGNLRAFRTAANAAINPATDSLGTLGGSVSEALGINDRGVAVGYSTTTEDTYSLAIMHNGVELIDLNSRIDPLLGWTLLRAVDINNRGQIIGWGLYNSQERSFLLTPILVPGDFNGDGRVTLSDINPFKLALTNEAAYLAANPDVYLSVVDPNGDGHITLSDINPFLQLLVSGSPAMVPEPSIGGLILSVISLGLFRPSARSRRDFASKQLSSTSSPDFRLDRIEPRLLLSGGTGLDSSSTAPPAVAAVYVLGTAWSSDFYTRLLELDARNTKGFGLTGGPDQLITLPWGNIDRLSITFTKDVQIHQEDLSLRGINLPNYSVASFSYDVASSTATWTLSQPIAADKLIIELDADSADPIHDVQGRRLDGEWQNPQTPLGPGDSFPSGDGSAGGNFLFRFNVLPADADRNGQVQSLDSLPIRRWLGNAQPAAAAVFADLDADGLVTTLDQLQQRSQLAASLPPGEPLSGPAVTQSLFFDDAVTGDLDYDFSRDVESVDPLGNAVAADDIRYDLARYLPDLSSLTPVQQVLGGVTPMNSGVDADGQTPLTVYTDESGWLFIIRGAVTSTPAFSINIRNTSHGEIRDLLKTSYGGSGNPNLAYSPKAFVVAHGLLLAMCQRSVWDAQLNSWKSNGTALAYSSNYGVTWAIAGQYDCVPGQYGREGGNIWCFNTYYPGTESTAPPLEIWLPYTDYNANSGSPGGQLFLARATRASVGAAWVVQAPVKLLEEIQPDLHFHSAGVVTGPGYLRLFLAKGDSLTVNEIKELLLLDRGKWNQSDQWLVFDNVHGQPGSAYTINFVSPVVGPEPGTLLVVNDVDSEEITLLRPNTVPGGPITFEHIFGEQASSDYQSGAGHNAKYEGLWLTLPRPETRSNYVGVSTLHGGGLAAERILYSPHGDDFAYVAAYKRYGGTKSIATIHGQQILLTPTNGDQPYIRSMPVPAAADLTRPALIAQGGLSLLRSGPWVVTRAPAAGNTFTLLARDSQGRWLHPDTGLPLDPQPPSLGPVYAVTINNASSGDLGVYQWVGSASAGTFDRILVRAHAMAEGNRLTRILFEFGNGGTISMDAGSTNGWTTAVGVAAGKDARADLHLVAAVTPGTRIFLAFDQVQIESMGDITGYAYPMPTQAVATADERLSINGFQLDQQWSAQVRLTLPSGYYDSLSYQSFPYSPLVTFYQDALNSLTIWADYANHHLVGKVTADGQALADLVYSRAFALSPTNVTITDAGDGYRLTTASWSFAGYTWAEGDKVYLSGGAGIVPGWYPVIRKDSHRNITIAATPGITVTDDAVITQLTTSYMDFRYQDQIVLGVEKRSPQTLVLTSSLTGYETSVTWDHLFNRQFQPAELRFANADWSRIAAVGVAEVTVNSRNYFGSEPFGGGGTPLSLGTTDSLAETGSGGGLSIPWPLPSGISTTGDAVLETIAAPSPAPAVSAAQDQQSVPFAEAAFAAGLQYHPGISMVADGVQVDRHEDLRPAGVGSPAWDLLDGLAEQSGPNHWWADARPLRSTFAPAQAMDLLDSAQSGPLQETPGLRKGAHSGRSLLTLKGMSLLDMFNRT
ncbi:MAG: hypothetical protein IT443_07085 [Phycisphaeraceae bacterium]|nr:hypothetical protein [Phycisphaeraceae bacterium]